MIFRVLLNIGILAGILLILVSCGTLGSVCPAIENELALFEYLSKDTLQCIYHAGGKECPSINGWQFYSKGFTINGSSNIGTICNYVK